MKKFLKIAICTVVVIVGGAFIFCGVNKSIGILDIRHALNYRLEETERHAIMSEVDKQKVIGNTYLTYIPEGLEHRNTLFFIYESNKYFNKLKDDTLVELDFDIDDSNYETVAIYTGDDMELHMYTEFIKNDVVEMEGLSSENLGMNLTPKRLLQSALGGQIIVKNKKLDATSSAFTGVYYIQSEFSSPAMRVYCIREFDNHENFNVALTTLEFSKPISESEILKIVQGIKVI